MGWLAPVAVASPDGAFVAYNAWQWNTAIDPQKSWSEQGIAEGDPIATPSIRMVDLATGEDRLVEEGAFSIAWRSDGAVAVFKGLTRDYHVNQPFVGQVLVRADIDSAPEVWSAEAAEYVVLAWAGENLLVAREIDGGGHDLLAFSGPGSPRVLVPAGELVAVSPDGERALVFSSATKMASLINVETGEASAALDVASATAGAGQSLGYLAYGGSWSNDTVVAESAAGIAVMDVSAGIRVGDVLGFPSALFPMPIHEPKFVGSDGSTIVAWAPIPGIGGDATERLYVHFVCEVATRHCAQGPPRGDLVLYQVSNPSRPMSELQ